MYNSHQSDVIRANNLGENCISPSEYRHDQKISPELSVLSYLVSISPKDFAGIIYTFSFWYQCHENVSFEVFILFFFFWIQFPKIQHAFGVLVLSVMVAESSKILLRYKYFIRIFFQNDIVSVILYLTYI